jgi:hypothetical protein
LEKNEEYRNFTVEAKVRLLRGMTSSGPFFDDEEAAKHNLDYETNMVKADHEPKNL